MAQIARICLTGPESTGKSLFAQRLAEEWKTVAVPEFARAYAIERENRLSTTDVESIARGQIELEERLSREARDLLVLDTDLISTVVYARHYYAGCPEWIEEEARRRRADLYLLMDTDLEWESDPARDASGDAREDLFDAFRAALDEFETRWEIVSGEWEARWRTVTRAARDLRSTR